VKGRESGTKEGWPAAHLLRTHRTAALVKGEPLTDTATAFRRRLHTPRVRQRARRAERNASQQPARPAAQLPPPRCAARAMVKPILDVTETASGLEYSVHGAPRLLVLSAARAASGAAAARALAGGATRH
jgi:hypothetical protein